MKSKQDKVVNFTDRKRISKNTFELTISDDKNICHFKILNIDALSSGSPENELFIVDAYRGYERKRFELGNIVDLNIENSLNISELVNKEFLIYSVKIISIAKESYGRILKVCNGLKPSNVNNASNNSLLPIQVKDLEDNIIWDLDFDDSDGPLLIFNKLIPNINHIIDIKSEFFFLIYPQVLEKILFNILFVQDYDVTNLDNEGNDDSKDWKDLWMDFSVKLSKFNDEMSNGNPDVLDKMKWIESVKTVFSKKHNDNWKNFLKIMGKDYD